MRKNEDICSSETRCYPIASEKHNPAIMSQEFDYDFEHLFLSDLLDTLVIVGFRGV
jgi:hypothetical protein